MRHNFRQSIQERNRDGGKGGRGQGGGRCIKGRGCMKGDKMHRGEETKPKYEIHDKLACSHKFQDLI